MSTVESVRTSAAWRWCVVYTTLVPAPAAARRRAELRSHLWEARLELSDSELSWWLIVRGVLDDLTWASRLTVRRVGRSFGTPMPYVAVAGVTPFVGIAAGALPTRWVQVGSMAAGFVLLGVGAVLAVAQQARRGRSA